MKTSIFLLHRWATTGLHVAAQLPNQYSGPQYCFSMATDALRQYEFVGDNFDDYINCVGHTGQFETCENQFFQWVTREVQVYIRDQSDGLVSRWSQVAQNTAWSANAEVRELPNNNHNEMQRSQQSRDELNRAFNGASNAGNAFFIPAL